VAAVPGCEVRFTNGAVVVEPGAEVPKTKRGRSIVEMLRADALPVRSVQAPVSPGLFA
jgi:hypothetical protein